MANPEHVRILMRGVEEWNVWRKENPDVVPDLEMVDLEGANLVSANLVSANLDGANLEDAHLDGANLEGANLFRANLLDANLEDANLVGANLKSAHLYGANLESANLVGANLVAASLEGANLDGANLVGANLVGANLESANLEGAHLDGANLRYCRIQDACCTKTMFKNAFFGEVAIVDCDLSNCIGLEHCEHHGPSSIDNRTIIKSRGLPAEFLKGCGWQDWEIESAKMYNPNLSAAELGEINNRIFELRHKSKLQLASLFISYAHADVKFVEQIEKLLENSGIRFWRDIHHSIAGPMDKVIEKGIRDMGTVLLILSRNSVNSEWVKYEVSAARDKQKDSPIPTLCPIALDDSWKECRWPSDLLRVVKSYNILPFYQWNESEKAQSRLYKRLLDGLHIFYSEPKESNDEKKVDWKPGIG